jgi:murein DD-endopeptidase MepM/ murein hydrolase activator NlpD
LNVINLPLIFDVALADRYRVQLQTRYGRSFCVIYQPDTSSKGRKSQHRQAIRRAGTERFGQEPLTWRERPLPTPFVRKFKRAALRWLLLLVRLPGRLYGKIMQSAFAPMLQGLLVVLMVAVPLSLSRLSHLSGPVGNMTRMSLALPAPAAASLLATPKTTGGSYLPGYLPGLNDDQWQVETVRPNETVGSMFERLDLSAKDLHRVLHFSAETQGLAKVFPGAQIAFKIKAGQLAALQFEADDAHRVLVNVDGEQIKQQILARKMETRTVYASATIAHSLFGAAMQAEVSDATVIRLAKVFNFDIDFAEDLQPGDSFAIAYEQIYRDGEKLRDGEILAATFINRGKQYEIYRFIDDGGRADYLSADGRSRKKAFIRTPVQFTRITSTFSPNRKHPVLGLMLRHMGVDYAAPTNTPIVATGNATVKSAGWINGYGNAVVLSHKGGIETLYGHMTHFAKGLHAGSRVNQGEVIGYVGQTGLATGPHVHYEFRIGGIHRDPLSVDLPVADPLSGAEMARFKASTGPIIARLNTMTHVAKRDDRAAASSR